MSYLKYSYVACPYSHQDPKVMENRFKMVANYIAEALKNEEIYFSPIVHSHQLSLDFDLPKNFQFWHTFSIAMLIPAKELIVLKLPGWEESLGVRKEIDVATEMMKPVLYTPSPVWCGDRHFV